MLVQRFSLKDLGILSFFLGVAVVSTFYGLLLSQKRYISDLLARTNITSAKLVSTPLATEPSLNLHQGPTLVDPTEFRTVVGSIQYLCLTRPDIAFAVNKLSQ